MARAVGAVTMLVGACFIMLGVGLRWGIRQVYSGSSATEQKMRRRGNNVAAFAAVFGLTLAFIGLLVVVMVE